MQDADTGSNSLCITDVTALLTKHFNVNGGLLMVG